MSPLLRRRGRCCPEAQRARSDAHGAQCRRSPAQPEKERVRRRMPRPARALPLTVKGGIAVSSNVRPQPARRPPRRQHLTGAASSHDAGGQVDRVALDRVGAAERRAEVTGEHRAAVDADAQRKSLPPARRSGGPPAASAPRRGRADAVRRAVSMILPPSRLMSVSKNVTPCAAAAPCTLRTTSSSASASAAGPVRASSSSVPENSHERHGDRAVLGLAGLGRAGGRRMPRRHDRAEVEAGDVLAGGHRRRPARRARAQQEAVPGRRAPTHAWGRAARRSPG